MIHIDHDLGDSLDLQLWPKDGKVHVYEGTHLIAIIHASKPFLMVTLPRPPKTSFLSRFQRRKP